MSAHAPISKAPCTAPSQERQSDPTKGLVDPISVGQTSRAWKLPFAVQTNATSDGLSFSGPTEYHTARNACEFARDHATDVYAAWRESYFASYPERKSAAESARRLNLPVAARALLEIAPLEVGRAIEYTHLSIQHPLRPPQAIEIPAIDEQHWYYRRHFNIGNYVIEARDPRAASTIEAEQDVASLRHYLLRYDALAKETSGRHLFDATTWAAFRDPYFSCIELCIKDLKIPSHFLALIHYGIGLHFAIGQRFTTWDTPQLSEKEQILLHNTHMMFSVVAAMYQTDFPR